MNIKESVSEYSQISYRHSQELQEAPSSIDSSASLGGEALSKATDPRDHRSNASKAHRTGFETGRTPGEPLPCT